MTFIFTALCGNWASWLFSVWRLLLVRLLYLNVNCMET